MDFTRYEERAGERALRQLSPKAFQVCSNYSPLSVYEREGKYYTRGIFEADDLTLTELDKFFSDIADALHN